IPRFLNRLLSLDCDRQNALFAYYSDLFDQCVAHARASGTFDEGVTDIRALSIKLATDPQVVYVDETTKAETLRYTLAVETKSTRVTAEQASAICESNNGIFYRQTKGSIVLITKSGTHTDQQSGKTYQTGRSASLLHQRRRALQIQEGQQNHRPRLVETLLPERSRNHRQGTPLDRRRRPPALATTQDRKGCATESRTRNHRRQSTNRRCQNPREPG